LITKDFYEAKLKQYETELNRIEDKLSNIDETAKENASLVKKMLAINGEF